MDKFDKMDMSLAEILGLENEYDLLSKQAKSPEEIEKWSTKEDMPEVKRCVHLMRKGYEIQKIAVINNLDRYMAEGGANEELFSLIIDSLLDWGDKFQLECAISFIKPLELDLINKRNKEKVAKAAVIITMDDDNGENKELWDAWVKVLENVVGRLDIKFIAENVTKIIKDLPGLKHPLEKRKRGNHLIFSVAKNVGEEGITQDPLLSKLIMGICTDNNYKIRRDGVIFLKEYLQQDRDKIIQSERWCDIYHPLLMDFLNDEDLHIQIDAIEASCIVLDQLSPEQIDQEFIPTILKYLDVEEHTQLEITTRVAEVFGVVVEKLSKIDNLHLTYKTEFIEYFKSICEHKEDSIRMKAVYNLPCMNLLYKNVQKETNVSFSGLWLQFSEDENYDIRFSAACSLHEAFKIIEDEEDTKHLRKCFLNYILDQQREIMFIMNKNLALMVEKYGNKNTLDNFKGRTAYIDSSNSDSDDDKKITPNSKNAKNNTNTDFSSAFAETMPAKSGGVKKALTKKNTHLGIAFQEEEDAPKLPPIYTTEEHSCELMYSDLLQRLMVFINNIRGYTGLWREHVKLIKNLVEVIHLFYMPEVHQYLVPMLVDFVYKGNKEIKEAACNCLAKILKYQHHSPSREELLTIIGKEMCQASNWIQRKAFLIFCRYVIQHMPRAFFKQHFLKDFINCSQDKVPHVRMEFANAMLVIKPFFDQDVDLSLELMDILQNLGNDIDRDVIEAVEHTDFELLQQRKKNKGNVDDQADQEKEQFAKVLLQREKEELEERKKRVDDDLDRDYDMGNYLAEHKRWRQKTGKFNYNRKAVGSFGSQKSLLGQSMNALKKLPLSSLSDNHNDSKTPVKRKSMLTKKTSSVNNQLASDLDFAKAQRKHSLLIGSTSKDKSYHQILSNGQQQINGKTANSQAKPQRRNTVLGLNGKIPTSGL